VFRSQIDVVIGVSPTSEGLAVVGIVGKGAGIGEDPLTGVEIVDEIDEEPVAFEAVDEQPATCWVWGVTGCDAGGAVDWEVVICGVRPVVDGIDGCVTVGDWGVAGWGAAICACENDDPKGCRGIFEVAVVLDPTVVMIKSPDT
jgi:hypothetical protein